MKLLITLSFLSLSSFAFAAQFTSAKMSKKINQVTVYHTSLKPRDAKLNETLTTKNSVLTGRRSRAELTFPDKSITRLGSNTAFSFKPSKRELELKHGTMLLQVPKGAGGATIHTSSVTAAITGTTIMFEYNKGKWIKLICLEGNASLKTTKAGEIKLKPGQLVFLKDDGSVLAEPVDIDLERLRKTSTLLSEKLFGKLPQNALAKIDAAAQNQKKLLASGVFVRQNVRPRETPANNHRLSERSGHSRHHYHGGNQNYTPPNNNNTDNLGTIPNTSGNMPNYPYTIPNNTSSSGNASSTTIPTTGASNIPVN